MATPLEVVDRALNWPGLTPSERLVLVALVRFQGTNGKSWPSREAIAKRAGVSLTSVRAALQTLTDVGLIRRRFVGKLKSKTTQVQLPYRAESARAESALLGGKPRPSGGQTSPPNRASEYGQVRTGSFKPKPGYDWPKEIPPLDSGEFGLAVAKAKSMGFHDDIRPALELAIRRVAGQSGRRRGASFQAFMAEATFKELCDDFVRYLKP